MYKNAQYPGARGTVYVPAALSLPEGERIAAVIVHGDCMEGAGINDGDTVLLAEDRFPSPEDICVCSCPYIDNGAPLVKVYNRQMAPGVFAVGTKYKDRLMQAGMFCDKIFGVAFACITQEGKIRWVRDVNEYGIAPEGNDVIECSFAGF